jgi:predicted transposase YdaD
MLYRAAEYHGMALRRKRLPIQHVVINLSESALTTPLNLPDEEIFKGFHLIEIRQLDVNQLLSSQIPEVVLLAVLGEYPREQSEAVLRLLVRRLRSVSQNANQLSKYLKQLIIIARLRKLEELTIKIATEMPIHYDIETDYLYLQGLEKGIARGMEKGVKEGIEKGIEKERLKAEHEKFTIAEKMLKAGLPAPQVAEFLNLSLDLVKQIEEGFANPE